MAAAAAVNMDLAREADGMLYAAPHPFEVAAAHARAPGPVPLSLGVEPGSPAPHPAAATVDSPQYPFSPQSRNVPAAGFFLLSCRKESRNVSAPVELERVRPLASSGGEGDPRAADFVLISAREYRLAVEGDPAPWAAAQLRIRLLHKSGAPVQPSPVLSFPRGRRSRTPQDALLLSLDAEGRSDMGFGFASVIASYQLPSKPPTTFRLSVEAPDGTAVASFLVHVIKRAPTKRPPAPRGSALQRAKAPKLEREADEEAWAHRAERSRSESDEESPPQQGADAGQSAPPERPPADTETDASSVGSGLDELADMFQSLTGFEREAPRGARPASAAGNERRLLGRVADISRIAAGTGWSAAASGDEPAPPPAMTGPLGRGLLEPPFRHAGDAARAEAPAVFEAALAAVRAAAAAAGVAHPVPAARPPPPAVRRACEDLAAAVSSPDLFDTPLFTTLDGRFRMRAAVEDLRLAGSAALVGAVTETWRILLAQAPVVANLCREDAELLAHHAWNALEVLEGPSRAIKTYDLMPVEKGYVYEMMDTADKAIKPFVRKSPLLLARSLLRRARTTFHWEEQDDALEFYFDAWSVLIREGLSPSRLEAEIIADLAWALSFVPPKWDLSAHFVSKMYWFCQDDEDAYGEAVALANMGLEASLRGRARAALGFHARAVAVLGRLGDGGRPLLSCCYEMMGHSCYHTGDLVGVMKYARLAVRGMHKNHGYSYQDLDAWAHALRTIKRIDDARHRPGALQRVFTLEDFASTQKWCIRVLTRVNLCPLPRKSFILAHMMFRLGLTYYYMGSWAKAVPCFEKARAHHLLYPAYVPPDGPRMRRLRELAEACQQRLAPGPAEPLAPAKPPPPPVHLSAAFAAPPLDGPHRISLSSAEEEPTPPSPPKARRPAPSWGPPSAHAL